MRKLIIFVMLLTFAAAVVAQEDEPGTIADIILATEGQENAQFNTLLTALRSADETVLEALSDPEGEYTVFLPTDDAFAAWQEEIGEEAFNSFLESPESVSDLLRYHMVEGIYRAEDLQGMDGQTLTTLQGEALEVRVEDDTVFVHDAEVTNTDIEASNGVIHVIASVLLLPDEEGGVQEGTQEAVEDESTAEATEQATTESTETEAATEVATATESATQVATEQVTETTEGAATAEATEGVDPSGAQGETEQIGVQDTDSVMDAQSVTQEAVEATVAPDEGTQPEADATAVAADSAAGEPAEATAEVPESETTPVPELIKPGTVADTVLNSAASADTPEFTTLLAVILASDPSIVQLLSDENANLTVFAPTDEAFNQLITALGSDEFTAITGDRDRLTDLILYHIVDGRRMAADLTEQAVPTMLEGQSLQITVDESGAVFVNGIPVVTTDIEASNGVIHVISGVLIPTEATGEQPAEGD